MASKPGKNIILHGLKLFWVRCDPNRPQPPEEEGKPPTWELQVRIDPSQTAVLEQLKALGLAVKLITPEIDPKCTEPYYRRYFKKPTISREGKAARPIEVVGGATPLDPNTIGNGSTGNIRIFCYEYELKRPKKGQPSTGMAAMLMGIQVTRLVPYVKRGLEFEATTMEIADADENPSLSHSATATTTANHSVNGGDDGDDGGEDTMCF